MSGHSHFATIKRQKESKDAAKGKVFSKMGRAISIAVKTGGGGNPEANYKLRMVIDQARAVNMPKENIERAISKAESAADNLEEVVYEGFGPGGVAVVVEATTDNRNRTAQEMKNLFEKSGGNMGGPGSVSYNFTKKGLLMLEKEASTEEQMLKLIDLGVEDILETENSLEVYVAPEKLKEVRDALEENGFKVSSSELILKPNSPEKITDEGQAAKILNFLDKMDDHDDVQNVFVNVDIPDDIAQKVISS